MNIRFFVIPVLLLGLIFVLASCRKTETAYYSNGQIKHSLPKNARGKLDGQAQFWFPNGTPELTAEYKDGILHGRLIRFHGNGNPQSEDQYENGMLNGVSREFYLNGAVRIEMTYRNDTLHGVSRQYDDAGQVVIEGHYENGYFEGYWLYRDRYGNVTGDANFVRGTGVKRAWNYEGKTAGTTEYMDNLRHGKEVWYDNEGNISRIVYYDSGDPVDYVVENPGL
ncbi:MAG: toxin-antitoxin system YwqK family antitoxin [Bacteroidales bacterium]|nr:toxin-antitoxin system YwqK family antitoxin [Bacteroidales bacterium]